MVHSTQKLETKQIRQLLKGLTLVLALVLTACGAASPTPGNSSNPIVPPTLTATPPFRAIAPTEKVALVPTPTPPAEAAPTERNQALFPTLPPQSTTPPSPGTRLPTAYVPQPFTASSTLTNGSQILFVQGGNLWKVDDGGTAIRRVTEGSDIDPATVKFAWTPKGDRVAYVNKKNELVIVSFGKDAPRPFFFKPSVPNLNPTEPAWVGDGKLLAFTLKPAEAALANAGEVWVAIIQGAKVSLQKIDNGFSPAWSPDGRSLAYLTRIGDRSDGSSSNVPTPTPPYGFEVPTPAGTSILPPAALATATPAIPRHNTNALAVYNWDTKRSRRLFYTSDLKSFPDVTQQSNYDIKDPTLARVWWSPDSRYIAFADQNSFVGVVNAGGGTPTLWAGVPDSFAVQDVIWNNNSTEVFFTWFNPGGDDRNFLAKISGLGTLPRREPNLDPMSSAERLSVMPAERVKCPALSPAGDLLAYYDFRLQAMIVLRMDWSVYSIMPGADCAVWSPDGRFLATNLRTSDSMIATLNPDLSNLRLFSETKGAGQLYWQRPEVLPTDPLMVALLTPQPVPPLQPGQPVLKPDQISPPASPSARSGQTTKPAPKTQKP